MQYFTKDYINFFLDLEKNNHKEWFHEHKKRYETHVKKPMVTFVTDLIDEMMKHDPDMNPQPKKCIGRINRDIRFSKDKTPYNKHLFAHVSKGTKEEPVPGIAFRFGGRDAGIMTGYYKPSKLRLATIRENISKDVKGFQKIISNKEFKKKYGSLKGEAYKRVPPELKSTFKNEPLIANKQFYVVSEKKPNFITSKDLLQQILDHWLCAKPIVDFLT